MDQTMPIEQEGPNQWPNAERWNVSPWVMYMNKVLGKLRMPYDLKKRFDQGPQDWTPWLEQLRKMREAQAAASPASAASR